MFWLAQRLHHHHAHKYQYFSYSKLVKKRPQYCILTSLVAIFSNKLYLQNPLKSVEHVHMYAVVREPLKEFRLVVVVLCELRHLLQAKSSINLRARSTTSVGTSFSFFPSLRLWCFQILHIIVTFLCYKSAARC